MGRLTGTDEHVDAYMVREHAMAYYWRLKQYEDTGLEPKEINRILEILQKMMKECQDG